MAAIAVVLLVGPADAKMRHGPGHRPGCWSVRCDRAVDHWWARTHRARCSNTNVVACIRHAAAFYHQPLQDALRVARCESGMDPHNAYTDHYGLFQFLYPSTWDTTPYARRDVWSAKWNSLAAMWMWANGRRGEWACQ